MVIESEDESHIEAAIVDLLDHDKFKQTATKLILWQTAVKSHFPKDRANSVIDVVVELPIPQANAPKSKYFQVFEHASQPF